MPNPKAPTVGLSGSLVLGLVALVCWGTASAHPTGSEVLHHSGPGRNRVDFVITFTDFDNNDEQRAAALKAIDTHLKASQEWSRYRNFTNVIAAYRDSTNAPTDRQDWAEEVRADAVVGAPGYDLLLVRAPTDNHPGTNLWNAECFEYPKGIADWYGDTTLEGDLHDFGHCVYGFGDIYPLAEGGGGINSSSSKDDVSWKHWLGYTEPFGHLVEVYGRKQDEVVGAYEIPRGSGYRPTNLSYMSCCESKPSTTFGNPPEREQVILSMYRRWIDPLDSWLDTAKPLQNPASLWVDVVDPDVIKVDWFVDGKLALADGGEVFYPGAHGISLGAHKIEALAYDEIVKHGYSDRGGKADGVPGSQASHPLDWVRLDLEPLQQRITWEVNYTTETPQISSVPVPRLDAMNLAIKSAEIGEQVGQLELLHPTPALFQFRAEGDTKFFKVDPTTGAIRVLDTSYFKQATRPFVLCITAFQKDAPTNAVTATVTIVVAPPSVLIADTFDDGNPQLNSRGIGIGFNRMWRDPHTNGIEPNIEGGEAAGRVWMKSPTRNVSTRLISYDTFAVIGTGRRRLTVDVGPAELDGGQLDILIAVPPRVNMENEFLDQPSFGVSNLSSFKIRSMGKDILTVPGPAGLDLKQPHSLTIEWTNASFKYLIDGKEVTSRSWPDGYMNAWKDLPASVLIASSAKAAPIELVLVEDQPIGDTGWVPPTGGAPACRIPAPDGGSGTTDGSPATDGGGTGGSVDTMVESGAPTGAIGCGCSALGRSSIPGVVLLAASIALTLAGRRRRGR